jgi:hypothetical protein
MNAVVRMQMFVLEHRRTVLYCDCPRHAKLAPRYCFHFLRTCARPAQLTDCRIASASQTQSDQRRSYEGGSYASSFHCPIPRPRTVSRRLARLVKRRRDDCRNTDSSVKDAGAW